MCVLYVLFGMDVSMCVCTCMCVHAHVYGYEEIKDQCEGSLFNLSLSLFFDTRSFSEPEANRFAIMVGQ